MLYTPRGSRGDLYALIAAGGTVGQQIPVAWNGTAWGVTLPGAGTYVFPFGGERLGVPETAIVNLYATWAAAVAGPATIEVTNLPRTFSGEDQGPPDVTDYDIAGLNWQLYNPAQAPPELYANVTGTGNSIAAMTATLGGTNAGTATWNMGSFGFRRGRLKLVATAGGLIRVNISAKLGS